MPRPPDGPIAPPRRSARLRRPWRSWLLDVVVAGVGGAPMFLSLADNAHPAIGALLAVLATGALLMRRVEPAARAAAVATGVLLLLCLADLAAGTDLAVEVPTFVAIYTLAATGARALTVAAAVAMVVLAAVGAAQVEDGWLLLALFAALVAAAAGAGLYRAARRQIIRQWRERVDSLQREKEVVHELAVTTERLRIAREMHDVVGHHLTVMVTLAQAAGPAAPPGGDAAQALSLITETGREALIETRRMLGVLRGPGGPPTIAPTDQLALTVAAVRAAGLTVTTTGHEHWDPLPADLRVALHRVVQESLTNALKYAGPGAAVTVTLDRRQDDVRLTVTDDGGGTPSANPSSSGHGLTGLRERLDPWAADVTAGPAAGGGWSVHVHVPNGFRGVSVTGSRPVARTGVRL